MNGIETLNTKMDEMIHELYQLHDNSSVHKLLLKMSTLLSTEAMQNVVSCCLDDATDDKKLSDGEVHLLSNIVKFCNLIYSYSGYDTYVSDTDYDRLTEYCRRLTGQLIISEPLIINSDIQHKYTLRGTLDKIYKLTDEDYVTNKSQDTLEDWIKRTERKLESILNRKINLLEENVFVMPKFDGVSAVWECDKDGSLERVLTRGDVDTNEAQDITNNVKDIFENFEIDTSLEHGVKTELMILESDLEKVNSEIPKPFKSTRSFVSSIINSDEPSEYRHLLKAIPLRYATINNGIESRHMIAPGAYSYPYLECKLGDLEKIHKFAFDHKYVNPGFRCDGTVIILTNPEIQDALGIEDNKAKYEVAFKFTEETTYSKVTDIEFEGGLFGRLTPVVVFEPVKMKGNTVSRAGITYKRFKELELCKGDTIKVIYDITPYILYDIYDPSCTRSGKKVINAPSICPECGTPLEYSKSGDNIYCRNKKCPCNIKGKILNYCQKTGIENISYATVSDFYNTGILNTIADLYELENHKNIISQLPGYGEKSLQRIIDSVNDHREMRLSTLLGSIGIEDISITKFKSILNYYSLDEIYDFVNDMNIEPLCIISGIKDKTANKIIFGIRENRDLINSLLNTLVILPEEIEHETDFSVYFTKFRDKDLEKFVTDNYGKVASSFTKSVSVLCIPMRGVKSNKIDDANKYGIPIVTRDEFKDYITNKYL